MESRVSRLEVEFAHTKETLSEVKVDVREIRNNMRQDFYITWVGIILATLGLAGLMAKGFNWL